MRGILVDPHEETVTVVDVGELDTGDIDIDSIYELIGAKPFDVISFADNLCAFVDDEGLHRDGQRFFRIFSSRMGLHPTVFAGKCLFLGGADEEGNTLSLDEKYGVEGLQQLVVFQPPEMKFVGMKTEEKEVNHPIFGRMMSIANTPIFEGD